MLQRSDWDQVVATTGRLLKSDPSNLQVRGQTCFPLFTLMTPTPIMSYQWMDTPSQALVLRGQGYFYSGDHDLAKRHYGEALKYDPDYKDAKTEFSKVRTS